MVQQQHGHLELGAAAGTAARCAMVASCLVIVDRWLRACQDNLTWCYLLLAGQAGTVHFLCRGVFAHSLAVVVWAAQHMLYRMAGHAMFHSSVALDTFTRGLPGVHSSSRV